MTVHILARVARHDSGWNGRACQNPKGSIIISGRI